VNSRALADRLCRTPGVRPLFPGREHFHEQAFALPKPATEVIEELAQQRILAGVALGEDYPELGDALLVCVTETKSAAEIERFTDALAAVVG
jgi:glycine dehydrogenase subunit 1